MSLQRRIVLPPLAIGVHPAPPPKKVEKSDEMKKVEDKDKDKKKEDKKDENEAAGKDDADKAKEDGKAKVDKPDEAAKGDKDPANTPDADKAATPSPADGNAADMPGSPGSMVPEPGTPGSGAAPPTPAPDTAAKPDGKDALVPGPQPAGQSADKDKPDEKDTPADDKANEPLTPIRLVGPAPPRPVRTALDLNPALPYPPINTDPRGAYHKYAKYNQGQMLYLDVTKDGWLSEQWREKSEREALAMLRGESEVAAMREAERIRALFEIRKVPHRAEEILLQLWNDLVQAVNHECTVADFWARYDWSDPAAQPHLLPAKKAAPAKDEKDDQVPQDADKLKASESKPAEADKNPAETAEAASKDEATEIDPLDGVEWTREGLEEILATAGVMCMYNTPKPLSRTWYEPIAGYLVLGHGFFMLRTEDYLQWKSEEAANKFEMLVTSGHDRVFGEMVKAQQAEERKKKDKEYKDRRLAEKRAAEKEAKEKKERGEEDKREDGKDGDKGEKKDEKDEKKDEKDEKKDEKEDDKKDEKKDDKDESPEKPPAQPAESPEGADKVAGGVDAKVVPPQAIVTKGDKVVVAVPVKDDDAGHKGDAEKHEVEALAAAPGAATKPGAADQAKALAANEKAHADKPGDAPKKDADKAKVDAKAKKALDAVREAQLLAKMVAAGQTPAGVSMEDIALAFKALEMAAGSDEKIAAEAKKAQVPLIWTWHDPCERWRWRNYEAGLHEVGPGGWEERDWRVFADDRGCEEYDLEESWAEADERDVHDWSL